MARQASRQDGMAHSRRGEVKMAATKAIRELKLGDRVVLRDPDGVAEVSKMVKNGIFESPGGAWDLSVRVVSGPHKGQRMTQLVSGENHIELA